MFVQSPTEATPPPVSRLPNMEHSRVALPEPEYLARIGEIAYTVSSMEWTPSTPRRVSGFLALVGIVSLVH